MLVIGARDSGRLERLLLGSVAERVVRSAPCAVLVVRERREAHPAVPEILPPCAACRSIQAETEGRTLWCARHVDDHARAHFRYEIAGV